MTDPIAQNKISASVEAEILVDAVKQSSVLAADKRQTARGRTIQFEGELRALSCPGASHLLKIIGSNQRQSVILDSELTLETA